MKITDNLTAKPRRMWCALRASNRNRSDPAMTDLPNTRLIPLTQGQFAIVDADDYEWLMQWKWCADKKMRPSGEVRTYYAIRFNRDKKTGKDTNILMHRLINNAPSKEHTDHINGNGLDNRKCNLRSVGVSQNQWNQQIRANKSSKFKGVSWNKGKKKWCAQIKCNGARYFLGLFDSEVNAAMAYDKKALALFGDYAHLNGVS